jgi:hypothetical protein
VAFASAAAAHGVAGPDRKSSFTIQTASARLTRPSSLGSPRRKGKESETPTRLTSALETCTTAEFPAMVTTVTTRSPEPRRPVLFCGSTSSKHGNVASPGATLIDPSSPSSRITRISPTGGRITGFTNDRTTALTAPAR